MFSGISFQIVGEAIENLRDDETVRARGSITLHYITLHYITLHYITLHYITLHYITLHYITLHYITLHYITLHYITLHYITLHYITLLYIANGIIYFQIDVIFFDHTYYSSLCIVLYSRTELEENIT